LSRTADAATIAAMFSRPVLPVTRGVAAVLVPILAVTAVALYGWPGATERTFAWAVRPELTTLLMGAGYASGVVFFLLAAARGRRWLEVSFGFVGVATFATLMGIATIIHWDRFNHGHPSFWGWAALYAVTPFLVAGLWVYNGGWRPARAEDAEPRLPPWARVALGVTGVASLVVGLVIFVQPSLAVEHWPWDVTPLTARVVASFTALNVGWAAAALDGRWAAIRIPALSQVVGFALLLGGLVRARGDLHTDRPATWIYAAAVTAVLILLAWLLAARSTRGEAAPRPPVLE
jgi:hypothetical protein